MSFCMMCGNKLPDDARFCPNCGTRAMDVANTAMVHEGHVGSLQPDTLSTDNGSASNIVAAVDKGKAKGRARMSPLILLALAFAAIAGTAFAAYYVYTEYLAPAQEAQLEPEPAPAEVSEQASRSSEQQTPSAEEEARVLTEEEMFEQITGWWRDDYGTYWHYQGRYGFAYDEFENVSIGFARIESVSSFESGEGSRPNGSGYEYLVTVKSALIGLESGSGWRLYDSNPDELVPNDNMQRSGQASLFRAAESDVPAALIAEAAENEAGMLEDVGLM